MKSRSRLTHDEAKAEMIARGVWPIEPYRGTNKPWRSVCMTCGEVSSPRRSSVINMGQGGCDKECKGKRVSASKRTSHAIATDVIRGWGWEPQEPYPGAGKQWACECITCGVVTLKTYYVVKNGLGRCTSCSGRALSHEEARRRMVEAGVEPLAPYSGSRRRAWKSRCRECRSILDPGPSLANIERGQGGCGNCASYGFNPTAPAYVYLLGHKSLRALKWGIANSERRIINHGYGGWAVLARWNSATGTEAHAVERQIKQWAKDEGLRPAVAASDMRYHGYSETVSLAQVPLDTVWCQIVKIAEREPDVVQPAAIKSLQSGSR
ncbi:hypothetical protein ACWGNY_30620 [[Kitasatospora] papulosa]